MVYKRINIMEIVDSLQGRISLSRKLNDPSLSFRRAHLLPIISHYHNFNAFK